MGSESVVDYILGASSFDPVASDSINVLAAALRGQSDRLLAKLGRFPGFDVNAILPKDVNGSRGGQKGRDGKMKKVWTGQHLPELEPGLTLLSAAMKLSRPSAVQVLLGLPQIDPGARDENGRTALFEAAVHCPGAILQILGHRSVDVNARDNEGNNALMYAARTRRAAAVETLVAEGIDISARNLAGVRFSFIKPLGISHFCREMVNPWTQFRRPMIEMNLSVP
jgi:hypothetical protein